MCAFLKLLLHTVKFNVCIKLFDSNVLARQNPFYTNKMFLSNRKTRKTSSKTSDTFLHHQNVWFERQALFYTIKKFDLNAKHFYTPTKCLIWTLNTFLHHQKVWFERKNLFHTIKNFENFDLNAKHFYTPTKCLIWTLNTFLHHQKVWFERKNLFYTIKNFDLNVKHFSTPSKSLIWTSNTFVHHKNAKSQTA